MNNKTKDLVSPKSGESLCVLARLSPHRYTPTIQAIMQALSQKAARKYKKIPIEPELRFITNKRPKQAKVHILNLSLKSSHSSHSPQFSNVIELYGLTWQIVHKTQ